MLKIRYLVTFLMMFVQCKAVFCGYGDDGYSSGFWRRDYGRLNDTRVVAGPKTTPFSSENTPCDSQNQRDFEGELLKLIAEESFARGDIQREYREMYIRHLVALRHFVSGQNLLDRVIGQKRPRYEDSSMTEPVTESASPLPSPEPRAPDFESYACTTYGRAMWRDLEQDK